MPPLTAEGRRRRKKCEGFREGLEKVKGRRKLKRLVMGGNDCCGGGRKRFYTCEILFIIFCGFANIENGLLPSLTYDFKSLRRN